MLGWGQLFGLHLFLLSLGCVVVIGGDWRALFKYQFTGGWELYGGGEGLGGESCQGQKNLIGYIYRPRW